MARDPTAAGAAAQPAALAHGPSPGGTLATLASVRLASEGYAIRAVYTYGSPRVGDRLFREFYKHPNYRFVNDNDLVPHLPFRWCYKHVGLLEFLDSEGNLTEESAVWQDREASDAPQGRRIVGGTAPRPPRITSSSSSIGCPIIGSTDTWTPSKGSWTRPPNRRRHSRWEELLSGRAEPRGDRPFYRVDAASREVPPAAVPGQTTGS